MSATNKEIAARLEEIGTLLRLAGANEFKAIAFDRASRTIETYDKPVFLHVEAGTLTSIPGIGASIANDITAYVNTGHIPVLEELAALIPPGLLKWLDISGLGPKKIHKIHEALGITELDELKEACSDGRVAGLAGMGAKSAEKILKSIEWMMTFADRCRQDEALDIAQSIADELRGYPGVEQLDIAGSLRRKLETIGDIDILVAATPESVVGLFDLFVAHPMVVEVLSRGDSKCSARTTSGRQVDVKIVPSASFPAAMMYFTGSKDHNVAVRQRARDRGMTLNEYGLYKLTSTGELDINQPVPFTSEADIYRHVDLDFIPPELREDRGEFEWIKTHKAEDLVELSDIRGILHAHSTWSDGSYSIKEMALACISAGYSYLGLTDHSRAAAYANGLDANRVFAQWKEIDALNDSFAKNNIPFQVLKGIESDILTDGSLDYESDVLAGFDFIIASVHSSLDMPPDAMLNRFKRAVDNPYCRIIGHPTGRLLLKRDGNPFDMHALIEHAAAAGVAIEINASPWRLDLDWRYGKSARDAGLMSAICPDAHDTEGINDVHFGLGIARKAGFTKDYILNAKSVDDLLTHFRKRG